MQRGIKKEKLVVFRRKKPNFQSKTEETVGREIKNSATIYWTMPDEEIANALFVYIYIYI